ncbi:MAG: ATP-binding protein [Paludibacteraceae bacterium]|nr:ATP-binding protein [Paludibacteraceae bacterium]
MAVSINIAELLKVLKKTPAEQNIMLCGKHGIGKSEILTKYYEEQGMKVVPLFLGQMADPGDLIGLPEKVNNSTEFLLPYWFPKDGKPIVLFLDELNRARPELLQTVMDLALNRKLAGHSLPEGSRIISAVNDGEEYQLTDLDPALVSRFNIYNFRPTLKEWITWADVNGIDERIIHFLQTKPEFLEGEAKAEIESNGLDKTPDRRAWVKVSKLIKDEKVLDEFIRKLIAGVVGVKAAGAFFLSLSDDDIITAEQLFNEYAKHREKVKKYRPHELAILNDRICMFIDNDHMTAEATKKSAENLSLYIDDLLLLDNHEGCAYFVTLISDSHPKFVTFISKNLLKSFMLLYKYVQGL